jgi:hypothetical protein
MNTLVALQAVERRFCPSPGACPAVEQKKSAGSKGGKDYYQDQQVDIHALSGYLAFAFAGSSVSWLMLTHARSFSAQ